MTSEEVVQAIARFEPVAKKKILEMILRGYDSQQIEKEIKKLIENLVAGHEPPKYLLDGLARSSRTWISKAKPLMGYGALAVVLNSQFKGNYYKVVKTFSNAPAGYKRATKNVSPEQLAGLEKTASKNKSYTLGSSRVSEYKKKLNSVMKELAGEPPQAKPLKGQRKLQLFSKAEMDLRHNEQLKMLKKVKDSGQRLFWISSHADCSKRCEKWQGKLVDIYAPSINKQMETGERVNGYKVYSLTDIMAQKDKYGYENNIINGFNCRHYLIPHKENSHRPEQYSSEEVKKLRKLNEKKTAFERKIREAKAETEMRSVYDKEGAKALRKRIKTYIQKYDDFVAGHGLVREHWRF